MTLLSDCKVRPVLKEFLYLRFLFDYFTFSSAHIFSSSDLENEKRLVHSSLIGNKVVLWSDATFVAHLLQVTDRCLALESRHLTAHKHAHNQQHCGIKR